MVATKEYRIVTVAENEQLDVFKDHAGQGYRLVAVAVLSPRTRSHIIDAMLMLYFERDCNIEIE